MVENELFCIDDKTQKVKALGVELARVAVPNDYSAKRS
jgi:hypothetical protein